MRAVVRLCAVLLATGCAGGGTVTPPATPGSAPRVTGIEPGAASLPASLEAECLQAARLSEAGEHKPAVDSLESVLEASASCPDSVVEKVKESRRRLTDADDLARRGLEARKTGDLAAAEESFRLALVAYPKYYWVQKLMEDLSGAASPEVVALLKAAEEKLSVGRPQEALELLEQAAVLPSSGPEVAAEIARLRAELAAGWLGEARRAQQAGDLRLAIESAQGAMAARPAGPILEQVVDFARRLGLSLFSAGELVEARDLWQAALSLDDSNALLRQYLHEVQARLRNLEAIRDDG